MRALLLAAFATSLLVNSSAAAVTAPKNAVDSAPKSISKSVLPWIESDYAQAVKVARAKHVPIFVEAWAPWCHTCRSMKAYVFTDPSLRRHAADFVWLDLDSENPRNAEFRRRYPVEVLPTMFVIDPVSEKVTLRWIGGATLGQLHTLLDDVHRGDATPPALLRALASADSTFGSGDNAAAARAYEHILAAPEATTTWPGRNRVIESLMYAYSRISANDAAVALAKAELPQLGRTLSAMNVASVGLDCAVARPDSAPGRADAIAALEAAGLALVRDTSFAAAADDRSGEYISLLGARDDAKDDAGHKRVAAEWATYLEGQAARAKTPDQRAVFDSHRFSAYMELDQPERAVPMLLQSEKDLPDDYNPPARLANAYKAMKRWDDALAANDRAMAKSYGPRKLLIYQTRVDIFEGRGDKATARHTLEEAIAYAEALPDGQRPAALLASLKKRLGSMATS